MSAASYQQGRRLTRPRTLQAYQKWVQALADGKDPAVNLEADSMQDQLLDRVMLSMRTSDGLDLLQIEQMFGRYTLLIPCFPAAQRRDQDCFTPVERPVGIRVTVTSNAQLSKLESNLRYCRICWGCCQWR